MFVVEQIYEGLTDDEAFAAIPHRLLELVEARSCGLFSVEAGGVLGFNADCGYYSQEHIDFFIKSNVHSKDPFVDPVVTHGLANRALSSAELIAPSEFERTAYYDELYRSKGDDTQHFLLGMLEFRGGYCAMSIQRAGRSGPFTAAEVAAVQPVVPHLRRVLGARAMLEMGRRSAAEALGAAAQALVITDAAGRLLMANANGECMLKPGGPLAVCNGLVRTRLPATHARLLGLLQAAGRGLEGGAMLLPVSETRVLRAVVMPWRVAGQTRAAILIDDPGERDESLAAKLAGLYGLTAAEAETVSALAEGKSPTEVADARGVGLATIRTQIHHALRKSDARSLAELVRLAASLPRLNWRPPSAD